MRKFRVSATPGAVCRLLAIAALGAILAGCDRCGWYSPFKVETQACRDTAPPPQ